MDRVARDRRRGEEELKKEKKNYYFILNSVCYIIGNIPLR
jgi:hypothetical protein